MELRRCVTGAALGSKPLTRRGKGLHAQTACSDCCSDLRRPGPGPAFAVRRLEGRDPRAIALGQVEFVPAVEQPRAARRIDGERSTSLPRSIVCSSRSTYRRGRSARPRTTVLDASSSATIGRQQSVVHRVAGKDVAEARRDHAADAGVDQRIDRRLARRAARRNCAAPIRDLRPCARPAR